MIYLIRHAESESNAGGKTANAKDIPLTEKGVQQSLDLVQKIPKKPDLIVVSPYPRTQQTAAPLIEKFPTVSVEIWNVHEFTYLDADRCNGTTITERKVIAEEYLAQNDPDLVHGNGAESFNQMLQRVDELLERLKKIDSSKFVVIFTHALFMRAILARIERKSVTFDDVFGDSTIIINNTDIIELGFQHG